MTVLSTTLPQVAELSTGRGRAAARCYLAGPISGVSWEAAASWRRLAAERLAQYGVEAIDPLRHIADSVRLSLQHTETLSGERALKTAYPEWLWTQERAIVHRSLYDVRRSQVVLANVLGARERSVGTIAEVAVAHEHRTPVVLVVEEGNPHDHPFLLELATVVTESLDEAIEAVWRLFS